MSVRCAPDTRAQLVRDKPETRPICAKYAPDMRSRRTRDAPERRHGREAPSRRGRRDGPRGVAARRRVSRALGPRRLEHRGAGPHITAAADGRVGHASTLCSFTSRAKMPARDLPLLVAGAQSLRLPAKQKTMRSELGAVRDPGHGQVRDPRLAPAEPAPHWDAHKWEQQRASLETVLSLSRRSSLPRTCGRTHESLLASSRLIGAASGL